MIIQHVRDSTFATGVVGDPPLEFTFHTCLTYYINLRRYAHRVVRPAVAEDITETAQFNGYMPITEREQHAYISDIELALCTAINLLKPFFVPFENLVRLQYVPTDIPTPDDVNFHYPGLVRWMTQTMKYTEIALETIYQEKRRRIFYYELVEARLQEHLEAINLLKALSDIDYVNFLSSATTFRTTRQNYKYNRYKQWLPLESHNQ